MMKLPIRILFILGLSPSLGSLVFAAEKKFVIVGVSGFKTIKDKAADIYSSELAPEGQGSGVWSNLPNGPRIAQRVFLTHYSKNAELKEVISLFENENETTCSSELGLIIVGNSWGVAKANHLAKMYYKKCGRLSELFVVIDGIVKPIVASYRSKIWAETCINFYQTTSSLHGASIVNCDNRKIDYPGMPTSLYRSHIDVEWDGAEKAKDVMTEFLNRQN